MTASSITTSTNDERAVLGCAVRDDKCAALVLTRLSEDDFTDLDLGDAFRELREVWKKYGRADAVTVSRLPHAELLVSCADTVPSLSGCEIYIAHVKEKAVQMKAATIALEIATGKLSTQEIAERAGDIARLTIGGGRVKIRTMPEMLVDFLKTHRKGEKPEYIKTGLGLEDFVRVKPGNFFVIGARPSVGKTAYPNATQINVYINSYGGSVFEGTAIYNQLRRHPAHKTVYVDGFACSIASVIAMAGDEVVMPRNALMMIHNMWMCTVGNSAELRKAANDLDIINNAGRQAYLAKTGEKLDEGRLTEMMDAETWLTAEECIALGLADRYAQQDADMSKAAGVLQKANLNLEQRISLQKSLAAQLRQLTEVKPKADLDKKEKQEQPEGVVKMLAGIFMPQK